MPAREQGMVGLTNQSVLGFASSCSFSHKHPGLVHQQLESCRRECVCRWKVISLSLIPAALSGVIRSIPPPWGRFFPPYLRPPCFSYAVTVNWDAETRVSFSSSSQPRHLEEWKEEFLC